MKKAILLILVALCFGPDLQSQSLIYGVVIDAESEKPLSFATVAYKGYTYGTIANSSGEFQLQVPDWLKDNAIVVSYMGYESREYIAGSISGKLVVKLSKKVIDLDEVEIKPLSPTDYLRLALRKIPKNYSPIPYETRAYYREKFTENGEFVSLNEGVFKSYFTPQGDTSENQHQLLLYRTADELTDFKFMDRWITKRQENAKEKGEKKKEKYEAKKERYQKKGKEFTDTLDLSDIDEWDFDLTEEIREGFGGPEQILDMDLTRQTDDALDSTRFKKFRYSFGKPVSYMGTDLLTINYRGKKQMDQTLYMGRIYLDPKTDAIVGLDYRWEVVIPLAVKPLLFAFGMVIESPRALAKIRYQKIGEYYFPQYFFIQFKIHMKKKYMWAKNEDSHFFMEMVFNIFDLNTESPGQILENKRFDKDQMMAEQVQNDENLEWTEVNTLKVEKMKSKKVSW